MLGHLRGDRGSRPGKFCGSTGHPGWASRMSANHVGKGLVVVVQHRRWISRLGVQIQAETLDDGVEKVNKQWNQGGNVGFQVWMEWKMDGSVVLGLDEVDG